MSRSEKCWEHWEENAGRSGTCQQAGNHRCIILKISGGHVKRILFTAIAVFALVGVVRADELEDSYAKLKATVEKKDAEAVVADAAATNKLAQVLITAPQPSDAAEGDNWKQRVGYGKEVASYSEYAIAYV